MLATVGHVFNAVSVDGDFGLFSKDGSGSFDDVTVKTDDPVFLEALYAASAADGSATVASLDATQLAALVDVARDFWEALGVDAAALDEASFEIVDLPGSLLGLVDGNTVYIDATAAGHGWFVDPSPDESSEFGAAIDGVMTADADSEALGRIDLLSVLLHETGHLLGLEHDSGSIMTASLDSGTRLIDADTTATDTQLADAALSLLLQADSYLLIDSDSDDESGNVAPPDSNSDPFTPAPPGKGNSKN